MSTQHENPTFIGDDGHALESQPNENNSTPEELEHEQTTPVDETDETEKTRETWGSGVEFLMSCIAMSVGLGNVWRFPFTALENGGGAFLIPYLIVLFLVGKPIYYLEMIVGQFSSRGPVKVFDFCPAMRGVGIAQVLAISLVTTYYLVLMGITLQYVLASFFDPLPWSKCRETWQDSCIPSGQTNETRNFMVLSMSSNKSVTSAELYYLKEVLRERDNINDGLGTPNWELVIGLFVSWLCVFLVIIRGVRSSGKAAYFLALFPYVIMGVLLVRAVTLPGAKNGIIFFIKPQWEKILDPKVWYAAVTQCFFSLSVCFGNIIMYSSYNKFDHNIYRDSTIVTALDTFTSLLAGFTIFGILGHLAHEVGTTDVGSVIKGDAGLAFISYPDAIAKFKTLPQIFSVLFFLMLFILGIGSNIAMTSCTVTSIRDYFPKLKQWHCALGIAVVSYCIGLMYVTPGGQFMLTLVDFFGASMVALVLGIFELYVFGWVYGTNRLCKDVEFMLGRKVGIYFRLCWSFVTPLIMTVILIYFYATYEAIEYKDIPYPGWAYGLGWTLTVFCVLQIPIWLCVAVIRHPERKWMDKLRGAFRPRNDWGPSERLIREKYKKETDNFALNPSDVGFFGFIKNRVFG